MGIVESEIISKLRNTMLDILFRSYLLMGKISSAAAAVPGRAAVTQRAGMNLSRHNLTGSQFRDVLCAFRL